MNKIQKESKELYSLLMSELASVSDLIYASVLLADSHPSLSSLAEAIAESDLTHYRLLSHIIRAQGSDPKTNLRIKNNFTVNEASDFYELFRLIAKEKNDRSEKYERLSHCDIFCKKCAHTLRSIADDERSHCEMILCEIDKTVK